MTEPSFEETAAREPQSSGIVRSLLRNLIAGARLAFFLRIRPGSFRADTNQAALLAVVLAAAFLLFRMLNALPSPQFNAAGLGPLAASYTSFLLGLWIASLLARSPAGFLPLVVMLTAAQVTLALFLSLAVAMVTVGLSGYGWWFGIWAVFACTMLWQFLIGLRAIRLALGTRLGRALGIAGVYLAAVAVPLFAVPQTPLWYEGYDREQVADAARPEPIDVERTFYAQPGMVDRALSSIAPGRPGIADLYFVGFAGYGAQDVFMKEVKVANRLFDRQFDTEGRSLTLVNNRQTIENLPLANVSNLRLVLDGLAERMDREEDVLFLFLTSHGAKDRLATRFWPLQHNDLEAADLRSLLDEAGIEWRVVVISACYSGSFVDELRSDRTLVITASRADRNSFGCSNEADMTYFGRALIDEALRETRSFTSAYDLARERVTMREEAEGKIPSEPQISVGSEIQAKLAELTERLEALAEVAADK